MSFKFITEDKRCKSSQENKCIVMLAITPTIFQDRHSQHKLCRNTNQNTPIKIQLEDKVLMIQKQISFVGLLNKFARL